MAGLVIASQVYPTCDTQVARKSGKPDFRCHPRLSSLHDAKTWMPATSAGMTAFCGQFAEKIAWARLTTGAGER